MAAYVDQLREWGWRLGPSCHMIADTLDELHAMAERIGLQRRWFQNKRSGPHYDLTRSRREKAVAAGVVELGDREFVAKLKTVRGAINGDCPKGGPS